MIREAVVAGTFYDADAGALTRSIEQCFTGRFGPGRLPSTHDSRPSRILGLVSPHAGYVYSGGAAAWAYHTLAEDGAPDTAVILGPNHHGLGEHISISMASGWTTPLGEVRVDLETAEGILRASEFARGDELAHAREHSIEVQLPFLQYIGRGKTSIVPIAIAHLSPRDALLAARDLGSAIATALRGKSAVVIASTDFTHYEPRSTAEAQDSLALERIIHLDPEGLLQVVEERQISMCGAVGTAAMITACKALGASTARKLAYYTSGDVIGDPTQVVGYGAASVERA